jgi:hypothetical protein
LRRVRAAEQGLSKLLVGAQDVEAAKAAAVQLQKAGLALTGLATRHACNYPPCSKVSGPSERLLVSGSSTMCAGCRAARYCSRECQKQQWKEHRPVCKALAAAAAAPAGAAAAATDAA